MGAAHCWIRLFASVWRVARPFLIFVIFSVYLCFMYWPRGRHEILPPEVSFEVVCSSLVEFYVSDVLYIFISNGYKKKYF